MLTSYETEDGGTVWVTGGEAWQPHEQAQVNGDDSEPKSLQKHKPTG